MNKTLGFITITLIALLILTLNVSADVIGNNVTVSGTSPGLGIRNGHVMNSASQMVAQRITFTTNVTIYTVGATVSYNGATGSENLRISIRNESGGVPVEPADYYVDGTNNFNTLCSAGGNTVTRDFGAVNLTAGTYWFMLSSSATGAVQPLACNATTNWVSTNAGYEADGSTTWNTFGGGQRLPITIYYSNITYPSQATNITLQAPSNGATQYFTNTTIRVISNVTNLNTTNLILNQTQYLYNSSGTLIGQNNGTNATDYLSDFLGLTIGAYRVNATAKLVNRVGNIDATRQGGQNGTSFNGSQYIAPTSGSYFANTDNVTCEAWFKLDSDGTSGTDSQAIMECDIFMIHVRQTTNELTVRSQNTSGAIITNFPIGNGNRNLSQVVGLYEATSSNSFRVSVYYNGILRSNFNVSNTVLSSYAGDIKVGRQDRAGTGYFNGSIYKATIWNRTLTSTEILEEYNLGTSRITNHTEKLVVEYLLNETNQVYSSSSQVYNVNELTLMTSTNLITIYDLFGTVNASNFWNNTYISTFNLTLSNGTKYTTTNGSIVIGQSQLQNNTNFLAESNLYIQQNVTVNLQQNSTVNITLWQSQTTINSKSINLNTTITNFSLRTNHGTFSTTNGSLWIRPNLGTYIWNWTNLEAYINVSGLSFTIDASEENLTISGLYARNISFVNNKSITETLTPTCTQDGYTYDEYSYLMPKSTSVIECQLLGYDNYNITNNTFPDTGTYRLEPVQLSLVFTSATNVTVTTETQVFNYTNITSLYISQINLSVGYVVVSFNQDDSGFQQIFKYYNDGNTTIRDTLYVRDVDLVQTIRAVANTQPIANARVCIKYGYNSQWTTTYCDYTNQVGEATVSVDDSNTVLVCVQAIGYETTCEQRYISPQSQSVITIEMIPEEQTEGWNFIVSTCSPYYSSDKTCTIVVNTYKPYASICIYNNVTGNTTCSYDSTNEVFSFNLLTSEQTKRMTILLESIEIRNFTYIYSGVNITRNITYEAGNHTNDGETIMEKVKGDPVLLVLMHILLMLPAILSGYVFEKHMGQKALYGVGFWFILMGIAKFYIFWIPGGLIFFYWVAEEILPMFKR